MTQHFDAIVIGTGQAGPPLAARLAGAGMKVAIVERGRFGGTCVNTGCIPTKTLIASAYAAHLARRAHEYGVSAGPVSVDMKAVKARKDAIAGRSNHGVEQWVRGLDHTTVLQGHARFEQADTVRVGDALLQAERIFINVGGRAQIPPIPGLDTVPYLTNSTMMDVDFVPEHLVIVGGSYIGLEFGQMYRRFGARVTIVEKGPRLIQREDDDVSQAVQEILAGEGIDVQLGANCLRARRDGERVVVGLDCDGGGREVAGSHLLLAVGRVPNTDDLGLERAGVATDSRGYIAVDEQLRTNVPGIWALGDCNGRGAFTHTAYNDYEIVAANLLDDDPRKVSDRIPAYALYIDPPLGRVGMTLAQARQTGRRLLVGTRPMTRVGRAVEKGESLGFMKVIVDADDHALLGASILGVTGDEVVHGLLDVMAARAPYTTISRAMHIHPTVSELVPTLLQDLHPVE
ncbi:FAD-containing oxidoreductase [Burkholderia vietnamiensis]|jgi:pyruvate/2-oxoglutarate dehydrogenase complex dihydrolipoamide dehydrogenase (E3) component|uniref:FAD-dependent pyridine nucleotide-disulfide oxidoreductase n=2 Tax=Burkholderia vietnamiensis TaxID=60552 RepID=A4JLB0_BURVG|nr:MULTISPECIES: FAD-containing oxidoreductase [Burkholderia]ABO57063.1 FAD-dependent pyridine nucleotide-disulfide oxidoreductase [Burkholderia vietnamiensis G4]AFJ88129.1 FAD-dependent NAD(P)-disulfide oxidoreductase [Burkholderia sp. KJ006]AJY04570.1 pyridine nucleotide-disulfide oxidoreductase family protein [Burkholderia vietnamiensis LMG 10929]AOJ98051.1 mercuric reductase [Burkholderia vietnamiensis]AOK13065.1 mercuric reductase [Burkholderia vietnamiensis]